MEARVVLEGLELPLALGTYNEGDVVPDAHLLDVTLSIVPDLVAVPADGMQHVFDYDPLIGRINALAREKHYETQEWLMTRIARACGRENAVQAARIRLYKHPVWKNESGGGSGTLGVELSLSRKELDALLKD
jgi:dihydroneopterin aldolase